MFYEKEECQISPEFKDLQNMDGKFSAAALLT
jgi:hypothetical protein